MSFHVGQQVVCVDDDGWEPCRRTWDVPRVGCVYTVREVFPDPHDGVLVIRTVENRNRIGLDARTGYRGEPFFRASRFRPVKQTSIEIFQQMSVSPPKEVVS